LPPVALLGAKDLRQIEYAACCTTSEKSVVREQILVQGEEASTTWQLEASGLRLAYVRSPSSAESLRGNWSTFGQAPRPRPWPPSEQEQTERLAALDECWHLVLTPTSRP